MSDQTPVPVTAAPKYAPDFIHELFWEQIRRLFADELVRASARMGKVISAAGASLLVLPDGSTVPRKMAHVAGRRYQPGDRVVIAPVQGAPVVVGGVLTAAGAAEAVIGGEDIAPGAITTRHVALGSITTGHIALSSLTTAHFADQAVTAAKIQGHSLSWYQLQRQGIYGSGVVAAAESAFYPGAIGGVDIAAGAISAGHILAGNVTFDHLSGPAQNKIQNAKDTADAAYNLASSAWTAAGNADSHAQDVYNILSAPLRKLCNRAFNGDNTCGGLF